MILKHAMAVVVLFSTGRAAADAPAPNPVRESWELSLEPTGPMRIEVDAGKGSKVYWYMLYTVTNNTGQDVDFHPEIARVSEIETEVPADRATQKPGEASKLVVDPAMVGLHPAIFNAIAERHAKTHRFLTEPVKAMGKLRQGRDNAISSVAVFSDLDPRVSKFTIYFGGLSGETMVRPNPAYRPGAGGGNKSAAADSKDENPRQFVLQKTLAIPYTLPGDPATRRYADPVLGRMDWVMR